MRSLGWKGMALGFLFCCSLSLHAVPIHTLEVKGNQRVDKQSILDYFPFKGNHDYTREDLDAYLKTLFETGLFSDVILHIQGTKLIIKVVENRCLNQIAFEGNHEVKDEDLTTAINLMPRQIYTPSRIQQAVQNIIALYRGKGRYGVKVTPKIIERDYNRVDLVFEIVEGPKAYIRNIYFVGNRWFSNAILADVISSREARWYRIFDIPEELYDNERVSYDKELLRQFYLQNGYADFRIIAAQAELSPERPSFTLTYTVEEGQRYRFGTTTFKSEVTTPINCKDLAEELSWAPGDWFNAKSLQDVTDQIGQRLNKEGHPFITVVPITRKNDKTRTIDVQFVLRPIPSRYIDNIYITGNLGTNNNVILRELVFKRGDPVNPALFSQSEKNLQDLDFFESVEITDVPASRPDSASDLRDVKIAVKDKSTGDVSLSGGYSTEAGPVIRGGLSERNFLGNGNLARFNTTLSRRGFDFDLGFMNPYLFGRPLAGGVDLFYFGYRGDTRGTFSQEGGYNQDSGGTSFNASYQLRSNLFQGWAYKVRRDRLALRHQGMSPYLVNNLSGHTLQWLSGITHDLVYDRLEKILTEPVSGFFLKMSNDFTGMGGNIHFLSNTFMAGGYVPLDENRRVILRLDLRYGLIAKLGYMRFVDQYYLGLFSFPGFAETGVGPRDARTGDSLGGRQYYTAALKLYFPLGLPKEIPLKGVLYTQSGSLWSSIFQGPYILSNGFAQRLSCGGGVIWSPPFIGKLGIVLSKVLVKRLGDQKQTLLFIWGQEF